MLKSKLRYYLS